MDLESIRKYCLKKVGVTEHFPFDEVTLVFKVVKIFVLVSTDEFPLRMNLKFDPENAVEAREKYEAVIPGYHMNKKHWNTIILDGSVPVKEIYKWIDDSYDLIVASLKKADREKLKPGQE
ncbi:MAG: MmcQ/YjbR family DNA-binding protein [Ignavibacteriales bacterium]|nr:MAG: MmcQ/YjbR family DNA-binding protein [Ignavibacteriales bacterium]